MLRVLCLVSVFSSTVFMSGCADRPSQKQKLLSAARQGDVERVRLLLDRGAGIEGKDAYGQTVLHWAVRGGDVETVRLLLDRGADINAKNNDGVAPLHWATLGEDVETVRLLLDRGADIEAKVGADGPTPLHWAAGNGKVETVRLLLDRGADINAEDEGGETPLDGAIEKNLDESHDEIIALLRRAGEK